MAATIMTSHIPSTAVPETQVRYPSGPRNMALRDCPHVRSAHTSTRMRISVSGLPPRQTSTLDIYENFHTYGTIVRIFLHETREGIKSTKADIDFEPAPPRPPAHHVDFETRSGQRAKVTCQIIPRQAQNSTIESPVQKGVRYEQRTELIGKLVEFGTLTAPAKMMVLGRSGDMQHQTKIVLNLFDRELDIQFPWQQISSKRSAVRTFRFRIALDEELKMWQLSDSSFVVHLTKPPWYSKQLAEAIANTHDPDAQVWGIEDTWARQTDLWTHKQCIPEINSSPVTLQKHLNDINISRWTTFRISLTNDAKNLSVARRFVAALKDWNVKVLDGQLFEVCNGEADLDKKVWRMINSTHFEKGTVQLAEHPQIQLSFVVRYQLEVCLSHGWISEYSVTPVFLQRLSELTETRANQALLYVALDQKKLFDPMVIFNDIHYSKPVRAKRLPDNCVEICSATVTATGVLFHTPSIEITNRIIRNHKRHAHRFLRVRFEDDECRGQRKLFPKNNNKMIMIFSRVKRALVNGIKLGNVLYVFLAWGNSQIREHGAYFFAETADLTADAIRAEMGDFKETVVAKKAARMGQCFSTTRPVKLRLKMIHEPDTIPDIVRNGHTFTDGVGKISPEAAKLVAMQLQIKGLTPCLFQFRLGGCKGVLAVSNDVPGIDVRIRKSQLKFNSLSNELEINRYAQFWQACLNRQIILVLSSLGVPTETFIRKQDETIATLNRAMKEDAVAINALRCNVDPNMMTLSLANMVEAGFRESQDSFVVQSLELWRAWSLKYLKEKAKIPVEKGAFVLGTVDETGTLQGHNSSCPSGDVDKIRADPNYLDRLPEIFIQITDHKNQTRRIIEGVCILARNPSLHRGDIRVVRARNVPDLHHMCDVVVMPQLGDRDLPSMCSGGDLDGDDYIVIWDKDYLPRFWNADPFHYEPPAPKKAIGEIKTSDLIDFFHDYMQNDALGKIASAHLAAADFLEDGLENQICLDLVTLHSMAVDYPKTGVPAKMERRLERPEKPHFMEKRGKSYHSQKVLGQLYDKINKFYESLRKETSVSSDLKFDPRILEAFEPDARLLAKVEDAKTAYDVSLRRILTQHSIRTELELWTTFVLDHSKKSRDYKFHEEVGELSRVLKEECYEALCDIAGGRDFDHLAPVAVAAYKVTHDQWQQAKNVTESSQHTETTSQKPFISFPWTLQDTLIKIAGQSVNGKPSAASNANVTTEGHETTDNSAANAGHLDEIYDVANFDLRRDGLSPYLPDPLTSNIVVVKGEGAEECSMKLVMEDESEGKRDAIASQLSQTNDTLASPDIIQKGLGKDSPENASKNITISMSIDVSQDSSHTVLAATHESGGPEKPCPPSSVQTKEVKFEQSLQDQSRDSGLVYQQALKSKALSPKPQLQSRSPVKFKQDKSATCFYWRSGDSCRYAEDECTFSHYETGVNQPEKQQVTCHYWLNGDTCMFDATSCKFSHHNTGWHALDPQSSRSSKRWNSSGTRRIAVIDSEGDEPEKSAERTIIRSSEIAAALKNHQNEQHIMRSASVSGTQSSQTLLSDSPRPYCSPPKSPPHSAFNSNFGLSDSPVLRRLQRPSPRSPKLIGGIRNAYHQLPKCGNRLSGRLIDTTITRANNSHRVTEEGAWSWANELQGLVFDDGNIAPREESAAKPISQDPAGVSTPKEKYFVSTAEEAITVAIRTDIKDQGLLARKSMLNVTASPDARTIPAEDQDLLLAEDTPTDLDKIPQASLASSVPQASELAVLETDLLLETNHPSNVNHGDATTPCSKSTINWTNVYGDPLTSGGDATDEPEIEELFD